MIHSRYAETWGNDWCLGLSINFLLLLQCTFTNLQPYWNPAILNRHSIALSLTFWTSDADCVCPEINGCASLLIGDNPVKRERQNLFSEEWNILISVAPERCTLCVCVCVLLPFTWLLHIVTKLQNSFPLLFLASDSRDSPDQAILPAQEPVLPKETEASDTAQPSEKITVFSN